MKRIIIDYKKLTQELAAALLEKYPQGYGDEDMVTFRNAKGEWVQAVELRTEEAVYLVKIGKDLNRLMSDFLSLEEDPDDYNPEDLLADGYRPGDSPESEYDGSLESDLQLEEEL